MLKQRQLHCCINAYDGSRNRVFAIGGQFKTTALDSVEQYDFDSKKWVLKANMHTPRFMCSATYLEDFIYVFGGFKDERYYFADPLFERYSITNDSWEVVDAKDIKVSSVFGVAMNSTKDNQIMILGGLNTNLADSSDTAQTLHRFNPSSSAFENVSWEELRSSDTKFVTNNGVFFKPIVDTNRFSLFLYNYETNQWIASTNETESGSYWQ
jgi:hypothetical protein